MSALLKPFRWFYHEFGIDSIQETGSNACLIITARACRMFAYGTNALVLALFFAELGFSDGRIGLFMTLTLAGEVFLGMFLTFTADRVGRRKVLVGGSFLMVLSGLTFAVFANFWILLIAAVFGVVSATGGDFGPFRAIEESILSQLTTPKTRADVLAWYVTISALGSAVGSEASGRIVSYMQGLEGWKLVDAYHALFWMYTAMGILNALLMLFLTQACELEREEGAYVQVAQDEENERQRPLEPLEPDDPPTSKLRAALGWLSRTLGAISPSTRSIMYTLWNLLAVDSIADGMVPYTLTNYYIDSKFHPAKSTLGDVTSVAYFLAAVSAIFAGPLAKKIGLINTMVFTHIPSSAAVLVFPAPNNLVMTVILLLIRAGLNNMDQAPRSAFIAAVVKPEERTAVMGITSMLRTLASTSGPFLTGLLAGADRFWIAFVVAGAFRLAYDIGLYVMFVNMDLHQHEKPPEMVRSNGAHNSRVADEEMFELEDLPSGSDDDETVYDGHDTRK
ncbi:MFS general substrate transporter [Teratosphaeria nubilosa]|uniref:MFS general substrate transporter n=1 Tax=Teratosphaeria nubilosa TaxID=161662 RepID=A0A6G1L3G8_9PEZI|nr:MFS general substrate transporter [Teratosphaeria nubilosa]